MRPAGQHASPPPRVAPGSQATPGASGSFPHAGAAKPRDKLRIADAQNVLGILYSAMSFVGLSNQMAVMPVVGYERVVFYRSVGQLRLAGSAAMPAG
jgi:hypothetical protein